MYTRQDYESKTRPGSRSLSCKGGAVSMTRIAREDDRLFIAVIITVIIVIWVIPLSSRIARRNRPCLNGRFSLGGRNRMREVSSIQQSRMDQHCPSNAGGQTVAVTAADYDMLCSPSSHVLRSIPSYWEPSDRLDLFRALMRQTIHHCPSQGCPSAAINSGAAFAHPRMTHENGDTVPGSLLRRT